MSDIQNIKKMLLPGLKGLPIIAGCFFISILIAYRVVLYATPIYETTAKIKLDDIGSGFSNAMLYKDFDVFSTNNKIAAEVELLKSKVLIEKALEHVDFNITYYRIGKMRERELYHDTPFTVGYSTSQNTLYDKRIDLQITSKEDFIITRGEKQIPGKFGDSLSVEGTKIILHLNEKVISHIDHYNLLDHYQFQINSKYYQINTIIGGNLDIVSVDKDIAVIRISFKSEVPDKTALFLNKLTETYIEDYIDSRTNAASTAVDFIDDQLVVMAEKLRKAESNLEQYRLDNNIINVRQETETDLRKISQLKIQLSNLKLSELALDSLVKYINDKNRDFLSLAPNFEAYNDLLSTELIKKIKFYQAERQDLLIKYTHEDEKVKVITEKLNDLETYLKEGIENSRNNIRLKRKKIEENIAKAEEVFIGLPTKEKQMIILEREFQLCQKTYNFLNEKRTEAAISKAANIAFHRVIQKAEVPKSPISPKKTLISIVSGFLGLLTGIIIVYMGDFIGAKIRTREELEKIANIPVSGIIKKHDKNDPKREEDFESLATSVALLDKIKKKESILITSTVSNEGKTYITHHISIAFANLGWKVAVVDLNLRNPLLHVAFNVGNSIGISDVLDGKTELDQVAIPTMYENLTLFTAGESLSKILKLFKGKKLENTIEELKRTFDLVLIDSPATAIAAESINLIKICNRTYYLVRANYTKTHYLPNADLIAEEYNIDTIRLLLTNVHKATNFNGNYTGSRFNYAEMNKGVIGRIKSYIKYYL